MTADWARSEGRSGPGAWGIDEGYHDVAGTWHQAPEETIRSFLEAMHARDRVDDGPPPPSRPTWVVRPGAAEPLLNPCDLTLEDGTALPALEQLPPDLPLGYHRLRPVADGPVTQLVVSPGRCHLPDELRIWGWAVQLYGARSRSSWGIGDLADLRTIADWTGNRGGRVLVINPLHAATPVAPIEPSPYFPSSRVFRNPLFLRVEEVEGASLLGDRLDQLARQGRALNGERLIDRDAVLRLKLDALAALWDTARHDDERFERFRADRGGALRAFATYCALAEQHGPDWHDWPDELRHPESPAIRAVHRDHADRVRFHEWLQWLLDEQLARAGAGPVGIVQDLAIGFDPGGADAWMWQDWVASGVKVGAPPDEFNTRGQDWALPPFVPWKLRSWGYGPFIETIRAVLRHAGGLRVDHVMGLFRLFWIPGGATPAAGTYVRYPSGDLLDILALESARAGAYVVGEDLGTVEPEVRAELDRRDILSYRLLWFEPEPPSQFPDKALAAVTTHDLPTVGGLWTGTDLDAQREIGTDPNEEGTRHIKDKVARFVGAGEGAAVDQVVLGAYRSLAQAPSMIVTAALDDALGVEERPNMPGTTDEWPNWSIALPAPLEDVLADPLVESVAEVLAEGRPS